MGSRFKVGELGAIEADERGGANAGAAGEVGCFDVGHFCEIAGCRSAGPNGVISSEATSGGEASACLRAFCCGTFSLIVLLATKFESPVCEGGLMRSGFKDRELKGIEADEREGAETGAADGVGCFQILSMKMADPWENQRRAQLPPRRRTGTGLRAPNLRPARLAFRPSMAAPANSCCSPRLADFHVVDRH